MKMQYNDYDYDQPEFCNEETRTARKEHKCSQCKNIIYPKEKYRYIVGKWNGDLNWFKRCFKCDELLKWVISETEEYQYALGDIFDSAYDEFTQINDKKLEKQFKQKLKEVYKKREPL
jgi:hypothetical protein